MDPPLYDALDGQAALVTGSGYPTYRISNAGLDTFTAYLGGEDTPRSPSEGLTRRSGWDDSGRTHPAAASGATDPLVIAGTTASQ